MRHCGCRTALTGRHTSDLLLRRQYTCSHAEVTQCAVWLPLQTGKADVIIAATESNHVTAVIASTGKVLWDRVLAPPMISSKLPCGNIGPVYGITGAQYRLYYLLVVNCNIQLQ